MSDQAERSFEQALSELEEIVRDLEDGTTGLDQALTRYEAGIGLLKQCYAQLRQAEQRIVQLTGMDEDGQPQLTPFEHAAAIAPERPDGKRRARDWAGPETMNVDLAHDLRFLRDRVESYLPRALDRAAGCPARLREAMAYSLLAPGKRLRPLLVVLATEASGGDATAALPAAAAVEFVHAYSLIHDDLPAMDDDDLRRGRPTCHKQFGEALAILAGDALLTLAFQVVAEAYPPATAAACCRELARGAGAAGMVGGQVEDLAWENQPSGALADLERIHAHKTGALFRSCLRMGAFVAQGERPDGPALELLERLDTFGRAFGLAFQITDDLLDVQGLTEQLGKRAGKDAGRGKLTYPGLLGAEQSRVRAQELCQLAADALRPLGPAGDRLEGLAELILKRDR